MGRLKEAFAERFLPGGSIIAQDAGKETGARVREDGGGESSVGQDIIADRDLAIDQAVDHAVIDALVVTTENDQLAVVSCREGLGHSLVEGLALWRHENDL